MSHHHNHRVPVPNPGFPYATGSYPFPARHCNSYQSVGAQGSGSSYVTPNPNPVSTIHPPHSWPVATSPLTGQPLMGPGPHGLHKTPCENCNHKHRCVWEMGRASCQRCGTLNLACKPILSSLFDSIPQSNSRDMTGMNPSPKSNTGSSSDRFALGNPLIIQESFKKPSLPALSSESRGSLVGGTGSSSLGKRGTGSKACIPTLDARLSRLENMLGEAIPNASKLLQRPINKYGTDNDHHHKNMQNITFKPDEKWRSTSLFPSSRDPIDVTRRRRISHALEIPEDPLLDGAYEDAVLAGQPVLHSHPSPLSHRRLPPNQNISTAMLFLDSSHQN
ncbi:hypothetical protein MJO28_013015 [Puccinia striiformis f. sp. tritici]|uniref:Uncharacterized protein n=4 Tax=Puccinia striiformis TaxID=27350 RepID=A0A0L0UT56_9BASI|nr:hypothetical protein Pst134EA_024512 [Puccinia striiformis f. sp. tritici]KNE90237.1 hypothetical protein PSTG_16313 [Puccinia striiformis f. sp. tritici PST-78]POW06105.1 hypothetical protein PSTT_09202 [Puccinia striiformis]KAH9444925.1 hypothetical protein Pst134EB_025177 [Puccinia striiformis f. sp. tritici]KAH9453643.1 hypothetical protein Pst134EA_024512 [Puccinia striiformis f. sp. tritici]KAI7940730.1 hypothetical protein MJO28_013015 [Puccinia striiformis f. sp. tritici]